MKKQNYFFILLLLLLTQISHAVDVAPRISDREIIESLAELKAGQKNINQRFENLEKSIDQRFEGIDQRFESLEQSINQRFESLEQSIDQRFDGIDKRFDFISSLIIVMLAGIFGLIGFIVWDRKTALRPLEKRMEAFERDVQHDLELRHDKGSLLTRLVKSLQELAKQDEKVAGVLRSYSLL